MSRILAARWGQVGTGVTVPPASPKGDEYGCRATRPPEPGGDEGISAIPHPTQQKQQLARSVDCDQLSEDRELARRVADGSRPAFDRFFREYFPRLFRFTVERTNGDAALAEEIVQRTMCQVVKHIGKYRGEALLFTWLCQICRNEFAMHLRKQGAGERKVVPFEDNPAVRAALESMSDGAEDPEGEKTRSDLARFVRVTLEYLPANYARALDLKYLHGYSVDEIASEMDMTTKAAESTLSRARQAFREGFRSLWDFEPEFLL